jgi:hypothetical protein
MRRFAAVAVTATAGLLLNKRPLYAQEQETFDLDKAFANVDWDAIRGAVRTGEPIPKEHVDRFPKNPYCEFCMSSCGQQYIAFVLACELEKRDGLDSGSACHPYFETFARCLMEDPEFSHHFAPKQETETTATETVESNSVLQEDNK